MFDASALALGWDLGYVVDGCVDPFNAKALSAARGATFRFPLHSVRGGDYLKEQLAKFGVQEVLVANAHLGTEVKQVSSELRSSERRGPVALVLSSESHEPRSRY